MTILFLALLAILIVLMLVDLLQTIIITAPGSRWREANPIIRAILDRADIDRRKQALCLYFLACTVATASGAVLLWHMLAPAAGLALVLLVTMAEAWVVRSNYRHGVRILPDDPFDDGLDTHY